MNLKSAKIAFVGGGRMAEALIKGLVASGAARAGNIIVSDVSGSRLRHLSARYRVRVRGDNPAAVRGADIILLCVKPQMIKDVLSEISQAVRARQLVISIAAGISTSGIRKFIRRSPVVRVMPNNPCLIGEGISAIARGGKVPSSRIRTVEKIFGSVGGTVLVEEGKMNAVTALSGSGPAFIYHVAEAMIEGGVAAGLGKADCYRLAMRTLLGSARTLDSSGRTPGELKDMVTSPGGTTQAGLEVLEKKGFKRALVSAIMAAAKRSKQLGDIYNP